MEELKRTWFKIVWAGLLLVSLALSYIQRYANAAWAQGHTMEVLQNVLGWIVLPMTVVLLVLHCIENWRTGRRYFWRKWGKWLKSIIFGCLMAALLLGIMWLARENGLDLTGTARWVLYGVLYVIGFVILYLRAKYSKSKYKKD